MSKERKELEMQIQIIYDEQKIYSSLFTHFITFDRGAKHTGGKQGQIN